MTWGEAFDLVRVLCQDPTSWAAARRAGWDQPRSQEWFILADLYDLTHTAAWAASGGKGSRPKPYPRPWASADKRLAKSELTQEETLAALRYAGHTNLPGS